MTNKRGNLSANQNNTTDDLDSSGGGGGRGGLNDSVGDQTLETEAQARALLQKLEDLKVWQSRQEERLLQEQRNQILELQQLGQLGLQGSMNQPPQNQHLHGLGQVRDNRVREDDDTTVSSLVYDDEISRLSEVIEEDSHLTWADRTDDRPQTKDLNSSNGSVMTLAEETDQQHHQQYQANQPPQQHPDHRHPQQAENDHLNGMTDEDADSPPPNPEEQVVGGGGKTFAQLMAEQLGVGSYSETPPPPPAVASAAGQLSMTRPVAAASAPVVKKPFLKRGTGLTRFNLPPDPAKQPSRLRRSKSQPGVADIQDNRNPSRLSQETLSFASKKTSPKSPKRIVASKSLSKLEDSGARSSPPRKITPPVRLKLKSPAKKREGCPTQPEMTAMTSVAAAHGGGGLQQRGGHHAAAAGAQPRDTAPRPRELGGVEPRLQDSVENSFQEKLSVQEKRHAKELKELAVFELLEDAANDSSFCSTSSRVKVLMDNSILPSPSRPPVLHSTPAVHQPKSSLGFQPQASGSIPAASPHPSASFASSTPLEQAKSLRPGYAEEEEEESPSLGETLMEDIRRFVSQETNGAKAARTDNHYNNNDDDDDDDEDYEDVNGDDDDNDEDDESTVCEEEEEGDDDEMTIGRNWRDRMADWDKENLQGKSEADLLEYSPPHKMPKNSPSYLIWSIFTKEREERLRQQQLQQKASGTGNHLKSPQNVSGGKGAKIGGTKSAPIRSTKENAALTSQQTKKAANMLSSATSNDDITYQSTLLQMRVVELEQEIDTFKTENNKLLSLKKKLTDEKQRLTKEWEEFEKVREENKKKVEEERRRVRRERTLLEKNQRTVGSKVCLDCEENRAKADKVQADLDKKENKWSAALSKLQEQVKKMEKENKSLSNENQRLRIKTASSKVAATHLSGSKVEARVVSHSKPGSVPEFEVNDQTPDSGIRLDQPGSLESEEELMDLETRKSISSNVYSALADETPRLVYSSADSLDSDLTLVSGVHNTVAHQPGGPQVLENCERGTREKRYPDGKLEIWYSNGNRKEVSSDGKTVKVFYYNGDLKESDSTGLVKYLYSQTQTWHLTYPDSREVLRFNNGQEEVRFPDGSMEISFPDGSVKKIRSDGAEDIRFPDGTRVEVGKAGDRVLHLPNGQREEHTRDMKKRVYPDGTCKILHADGRQETRYSNGRVRVKDKDGKLIKDTHS